MPPKRKRAVPVNNGSDVKEPTVRQASTNVSFYDPNIDSKLYTFWRAQVPPATDLHLDAVPGLPTKRDPEALMECYQ